MLKTDRGDIMSFSLGSLPIINTIKTEDGRNKKDTIARCYMIIKNLDIVTDNVRDALTRYLTDRLKSRSATNLDSNRLWDNIKELLEYCCCKKYENITIEDVKSNESLIIQHIEWCIKHHNTKRLIWIDE